MEVACSSYDCELKKTIIIIPAYKPIDVLKDIVRKLYAQNFLIIVVDDGSGTEYKPIFDYVGQYALVLKHKENMGKGSALKTAYRYIRDNFEDYDAVITADADGQHKIEDIVKLHNAILNGDDRFIIGGRLFTGKVPLRSKFGNDITRMVFAKASRIKVNDTQTGLRAFKMSLIPELINVDGNRYEYEMNVLLWATANNIDIREETIETVYDCENNPSHFRVIKDSIMIYSSVIKFALSSFSSFIVDFILLLLFNRIFDSLGAGTDLVISVILARIISSIYNFTINKLIVFKSRDNTAKRLSMYYVLSIFILGANCSLMYLLNIILSVNITISKVLVETALFVLSYFVQNKYIFKK